MGKYYKRRYERYLNSAAWKKLRELVRERGEHRCEECGGCEQLQVHHLTYRRLGHERLDDLQLLCKWCHESKHAVIAKEKREKKEKKAQLVSEPRAPRARKARPKSPTKQQPSKKLRLIEENNRLHATFVANRAKRERVQEMRTWARQ